MSKTLKERRQELNRRESALRRELDFSSDSFKEKAKQVGKIALVSGGVALVGYWIYKAFFQEEDDEKPSKKTKKRKKAVKGVSSRLAEIALPYIGKMLSSVFEMNERTKKKEEIDED
jgi:precorrin-3B methylase